MKNGYHLSSKIRRVIEMSQIENVLAPYLTCEKLAEQLDVTVRTLERWRSEGKGPPVTIKGSVPIYRIEAVQAWLRACEKPMPRSPRQRGAA